MSENVYHDHLDECEQCRNNPMMMCPEGHRRLKQQVTGQDPGPQRAAPKFDLMADFSEAEGLTPEEATLVRKFVDDLGFSAIFD